MATMFEPSEGQPDSEPIVKVESSKRHGSSGDQTVNSLAAPQVFRLRALPLLGSLPLVSAKPSTCIEQTSKDCLAGEDGSDTTQFKAGTLIIRFGAAAQPVFIDSRYIGRLEKMRHFENTLPVQDNFNKAMSWVD